MPEFKAAKEHAEAFKENTKRRKVSGKTQVVIACPFCAAPDFTIYEIENPTQDIANVHAGCDECKRGASMVLNTKQGVVSVEILRESGPDVPKWFKDKQRKFTV